MKFGNVYAHGSGRRELHLERNPNLVQLPDGSVADKKDLQNQLSEAEQITAKHQWLQSTTTQELLRELKQREIALINEAIAHAMNSHSPVNEKQAVKTLQQVYELRAIGGMIVATHKPQEKPKPVEETPTNKVT